MLSPHPADPTLTTGNLMEVVKGVEDHWWGLGGYFGVPESKRSDIRSLYHSDHHRMEAVLHHYVKYNPAPSWKAIATTLQWMKLHKQADEVTTKYVKGMDVNHVTLLILIQAVYGQLYQYQTNQCH